MPNYTVLDSQTGKKVTFQWNGQTPPTDADMEQVFSEARTPAPTPETKIAPLTWRQKLEPYGRPVLEGGGALVGGAITAPVAAATGPAAPITEAAGIGAGYLGGKAVADYIFKPPLKSFTAGAVRGAKDIVESIPEAAMVGMGGPVVGKALPAITKAGAKIGGQLIGKLTGTGTGAVEEAFKSGKSAGVKSLLKTTTNWEKASRGALSEQEVVQNARNSLRSMKDQMRTNYLGQLEKISSSKTSLPAIKSQLDQTMENLASSEKFSIRPRYDDQGKLLDRFDFSNSTIVKGQAAVKRAMEDVAGWSDTSAKGLDLLKKRLSTYIDQVKTGTPAEAFLTRLEKSLDSGLKEAIPGYKEMTGGYAKAITLIKDIESGLMMRKEGMSGRIISDQTLRRLMSSLRDNFELRRTLVKSLSEQSGQDITGQVAGIAMKPLLPRGLAGTGPAIVGDVALAHFLNPAFWPTLGPIVAMSSPKVAGEFVNMLGKFAIEMAGIAKPLATLGVAESAKPIKWLPSKVPSVVR